MSIVCTEAVDLRFCRKMSADVNQGPMFLARAMVTGRQIYPFHEAALGNPGALVRCEFRVRDVSAAVSSAHVEDLLKRLENYELVDAHTIDGVGAVIDRVPLLMSVGT